MIDTHAHIYLEQFDDDLEEVVKASLHEGIDRILLPNIDSSTTQRMTRSVQKFPGICLPMMGLHPCSVKEDYKEKLEKIHDELVKGDFIAVGEIGTDLYWDKTFWNEQQEAFNIQCEWALAEDLPIVIHCRESIPETIDLVRPWSNKGLKGVFHCFTGNLDQAKEITDMDFYLGFGGVSTFKNGGQDKVLPYVDRTRVVLETDSPYLAPTPNRGKRNEPAFLKLIAQRIADLWETDLSEVDQVTTTNAINLFRLE